MANSTIMLNEAGVAVSIVSPLVVRILMAVVALLLGFIVGKLAERIILKLFEISNLDRILRRYTKIRARFSVILSTIASYCIYILSIVYALSKLGIATPVITTIVIFLVIVLVLFLIFGLNDIFANLFAGLVVRLKGNISLGDYIRIKDKHVEGYVVGISSLNIRLETQKGDTVFIPNMVLFKSEIIKPKAQGNSYRKNISKNK